MCGVWCVRDQRTGRMRKGCVLVPQRWLPHCATASLFHVPPPPSPVPSTPPVPHTVWKDESLHMPSASLASLPPTSSSLYAGTSQPSLASSGDPLQVRAVDLGLGAGVRSGWLTTWTCTGVCECVTSVVCTSWAQERIRSLRQRYSSSLSVKADTAVHAEHAGAFLARIASLQKHTLLDSVRLVPPWFFLFSMIMVAVACFGGV